jgi:choline monooxygenase
MSVNSPINPAGLHDTVLAAIDRPISDATGLPNQAYTDPGFFAFERDRLWADTWVCIGFASETPAKGSARPLSLMGLPLMVVRDQKDQIRVFHNVCSHRGHPLISQRCQLQGAIRCPYHSWMYALDGQLRGTPHIGGVNIHETAGFERSRHGLREVRSALWLDLLFVNLSGAAPALEQHLGELTDRWQQFCGADGFSRLRPAADFGTLQLEARANWKLLIENNNESYHLPWVHPGLNSYSRLEDHYPIFGADFAGQGSYVYDLSGTTGIGLPGFAHWPQDRLKHAEYASLYPNVLLGFHIDQFWAIVIEPLAPDHTRERMQIYLLDEAADGSAYEHARQTLLESWRTIFIEDISVVEGMQQGRHSPAFGGGVFSPVMDTPTHHFHRWAASRLTSA